MPCSGDECPGRQEEGNPTGDPDAVWPDAVADRAGTARPGRRNRPYWLTISPSA